MKVGALSAPEEPKMKTNTLNLKLIQMRTGCLTKFVALSIAILFSVFQVPMVSASEPVDQGRGVIHDLMEPFFNE